MMRWRDFSAASLAAWIFRSSCCADNLSGVMYSRLLVVTASYGTSTNLERKLPDSSRRLIVRWPLLRTVGTTVMDRTMRNVCLTVSFLLLANR